ncbi:MAG: hypothetical protein R2823_08680 [Acidimicrobiia bacterium]
MRPDLDHDRDGDVVTRVLPRLDREDRRIGGRSDRSARSSILWTLTTMRAATPTTLADGVFEFGPFLEKVGIEGDIPACGEVLVTIQGGALRRGEKRPRPLSGNFRPNYLNTTNPQRRIQRSL